MPGSKQNDTTKNSKNQELLNRLLQSDSNNEMPYMVNNQSDCENDSVRGIQKLDSIRSQIDLALSKVSTKTNVNSPLRFQTGDGMSVSIDDENTTADHSTYKKKKEMEDVVRGIIEDMNNSKPIEFSRTQLGRVSSNQTSKTTAASNADSYTRIAEDLNKRNNEDEIHKSNNSVSSNIRPNIDYQKIRDMIRNEVKQKRKSQVDSVADSVSNSEKKMLPNTDNERQKAPQYERVDYTFISTMIEKGIANGVKSLENSMHKQFEDLAYRVQKLENICSRQPENVSITNESFTVVLNKRILQIEKAILLLNDQANVPLKKNDSKKRLERVEKDTLELQELCTQTLAGLKTKIDNFQSIRQSSKNAAFELSEIAVRIDEKLDTSVLTEFAKHIVTKKELVKSIGATLNSVLVQIRPNNLLTNHDLKLTVTEWVDFIKMLVAGAVEGRLGPTSPAKSNRGVHIYNEIRGETSNARLLNMMAKLELDLKKELDLVGDSQKNMEENVRENIRADMEFQVSESVKRELELARCGHAKLSRDVDEKLYKVCTEVSAVKELFARQTELPFYKTAQWQWKSGRLKLGSAIPWEIQTVNTGNLLIDSRCG